MKLVPFVGLLRAIGCPGTQWTKVVSEVGPEHFHTSDENGWKSHHFKEFCDVTLVCEDESFHNE